MDHFFLLLVTMTVCVQGRMAAGPLCYRCFHYSRAEDGENLQEAFQNDFHRMAPTIMGVFKNSGTIDGSTPSQEACRDGSGMTTRRCATGQKCLSYKHAWKSSHYRSLASRREWVMTWRDCVDATFDCNASAMKTLDAQCCTTDRCNNHQYNAAALLSHAKK